jgi:hypothetical protein
MLCPVNLDDRDKPTTFPLPSIKQLQTYSNRAQVAVATKVLHVQLREGDLSARRVATGNYLHKPQNVEKEEAENKYGGTESKKSCSVWSPLPDSPSSVHDEVC